MTVHVVLFEPEIPQNTGNIARTCACVGARLHLVEPLGFRLSAKQLGRAGMDYWDDVDVSRWPCTEAFLEAHAADDLHFFTGRADRSLADEAFEDETYLVFGRESRGIDAGILRRHERRCVRIPMMPGKRSLNLSNAAAIATYDVMRRRGYAGLD
jgi:tRNA (cytidine/uridine-2'-O-)-methyltransferase